MSREPLYSREAHISLEVSRKAPLSLESPFYWEALCLSREAPNLSGGSPYPFRLSLLVGRPFSREASLSQYTPLSLEAPSCNKIYIMKLLLVNAYIYVR